MRCGVLSQCNFHVHIDKKKKLLVVTRAYRCIPLITYRGSQCPCHQWRAKRSSAGKNYLDIWCGRFCFQECVICKQEPGLLAARKQHGRQHGTSIWKWRRGPLHRSRWLIEGALCKICPPASISTIQSKFWALMNKICTFLSRLLFQLCH